MISRILVTLDGSDLAEKVLPYAKDLAARMHARLFLLQVVEPRLPELATSESVTMDAFDTATRQTEAEMKAAVDYLSRLAGALETEGIHAQCEVLEGQPANKIIEFVRTEQIDLIAMSTHGRSGLGRLVFGSVADAVLHQCGTPILLIKAGDHR